MTEEKIRELEEASATLRQQIEDLEKSLKDAQEERTELTEYKEQREREDAEAELLKNRLGILTEAGFEFNEEQIKSNKSFWVSLDDEAFGSYVGHIKEVQETAQASDEGANSGIPDLSSDASREKELETLSNYLDKRYKEKS